MMAKAPTAEAIGANLSARERVLLFCLALQLLFCFEVRSLSERLVSSTPE